MPTTSDVIETAQNDETAAELRAVAGLLIRRMREESNSAELTWSQGLVLSHLDRNGPATVTELARVERVRSQSMGATVGVLESRGLVVGEPDQADGRRKVLRLSDEGRAMLKTQRREREGWLSANLTDRLSAEERDVVARSLPLLRRLAERDDV